MEETLVLQFSIVKHMKLKVYLCVVKLILNSQVIVMYLLFAQQPVTEEKMLLELQNSLIYLIHKLKAFYQNEDSI